MKSDPAGLRARFPILKQQVHGKDLVYLDSAATTLKPDTVIQAVSEHYSEYSANIHRGVHFLSEKATAAYEAARENIRDFIGAEKTSEIIFTSGTTDSLNLAALSLGSSLKEGDEVLITGMEHHSNIVPWQILRDTRGVRLKVAPIDDRGQVIYDEYKKLLNERTRIVSMVHISNSLGTINPVKEMIRDAKAAGSITILDGAQSTAHMPVDVKDLNCDFFALSGHKIFGPTGVGVLYGREELLEKLPPVKGGGDMILSVTFEKTTFAALPFKFEAGTPNIAGVIGMGKAVDFIRETGFETIKSHEHDLLAYGTEILLGVPGLRLIGTAEKKSGILSFVLDEIHPHDIGTLIDKEGVAIRTGHHCTQPVMKHFNIPATARASLSVYNNRDDIDCLAAAIHKVREIFA